MKMDEEIDGYAMRVASSLERKAWKAILYLALAGNLPSLFARPGIADRNTPLIVAILASALAIIARIDAPRDGRP